MGPKIDQLIKNIESGARPTSVDLSNDGLTDFPDILILLKDFVEFINLGGNQLSDLPDVLSTFHNLKILFFAGNNFTHVPECLGLLPNIRMLSFKSNKVRYVSEASLSPSLKWLILTDNKIAELPKSIGKLAGLRKLMLSGNRLTHLPEELQNCQELELCRLACNLLPGLPHWFTKLPKLTWLAFSGNKLEHSRESSCCEEIDWSDIVVEEVLGEGASGTVYKARVPSISLPDTFANAYALKVFKGEITSDGLAEDEIKVNEFVSNHPRFIKVLAKLRNHPEKKQALLLPLLPPDTFRILGLAPSFDSITRDTFPAHTLFSLSFVLNVLRGIAEACEHLSGLGIMHGDLYAHNILTDEDGQPLLTDFGAAGFYECASLEKEILEGIEVRAMGCLIEDLTDRVELGEDNGVVGKLREIVQRCKQADSVSRPRFKDLVIELKNLAL